MVSMQFEGSVLDVRLCPDCGASDLEVANYIDSSPTLECLGCMAVIAEVTRAQAVYLQSALAEQDERSDDPLEGE